MHVMPESHFYKRNDGTLAFSLLSGSFAKHCLQRVFQDPRAVQFYKKSMELSSVELCLMKMSIWMINFHKLAKGCGVVFRKLLTGVSSVLKVVKAGDT